MALRKGVRLFLAKHSKKVSGKAELAIFLFYLILGGIAIRIGGNTGLNPGWLLLGCRTMFFLACFGSGRFYRSVLKSHDTLPSSWYFAIVLSLQLIALTASNILFDRGLTYASSWCTFPDGVLLTYAGTFLGIAFLLRICRIFGKAIGNTGPVRLIADNTFSIMCHQYLGFFCVDTLFALAASTTPLFDSFSFSMYSSDLFYFFYFPNDLPYYALLYCAAGILLPVGIHRAWCAVRAGARNLLRVEDRRQRYLS